MNILRTFAAAAVLFLPTLPAFATDHTDLWWNSAENGWGLNVAHQENVLFLTFFIYGPNNQPYWVSGSETFHQGNNVYSGPLYHTTGPFYGAGWGNPPVGVQNVGTVTFTVTSMNAATLSYTINGVTVNKSLTRLTMKNNPNLNGTYVGGFAGSMAPCPGNPGDSFDAVGPITVSGNLANTQISFQQAPGTGTGSCTLSGPYTQAGRLGVINGTMQCAGEGAAAVTVFEIDANAHSFSARYTSTFGGCTETGRIAAARK